MTSLPLSHNPRMDDLLSDPAPSATAPPPPTAPPAPGSTRAPGRPPKDPSARAAADERYAAQQAFAAALPDAVKEYRIAIFEARRESDTKASHRPLCRIRQSEWAELGLQDQGALRSWLAEKLGPGRYLLEPQDQHNKRVDKLPHWVETTDEDDEEDDMPDFEDAPRGRRGWHRGRSRRRESYLDDLDYEDDEPLGIEAGTSRSGIADFLTASVQSQAAKDAETTRSQSDMMTTLMLMQEKSKEEQRRADERREEREREERRREEAREERRREEERRAYEERQAELRREEDAREERRREERRREEERMRAMSEASAKRMEMMMGAFTAAIPVLAKVFEKKEDPLVATLLSKMSDKPTADPVTMMMMKHFLETASKPDAGQQGITMMMQTMNEMSKMSSTMMMEQMRGIIGNMTTMQQETLKQTMKMALANPNLEEEQKGMLGQIVEAISGAGEIMSALTGGQQPQSPPQMSPQAAPSGFIAQQQAQGAIPQQPQQQDPQTTEQPQAEGHAPVMTQIEGQQQQEEVPSGIEAVGGCLKALQTQAVTTQDEVNQLVTYMITEMPEELRRAIVAGDEQQIIQIATPAFMGNAELKAWLMQPGVVDWVRAYLPQLGEPIRIMEEQMSQMQADAQDQQGQVEPGTAGASDGGPDEGGPEEGSEGEDEDDPV